MDDCSDAITSTLTSIAASYQTSAPSPLEVGAIRLHLQPAPRPQPETRSASCSNCYLQGVCLPSGLAADRVGELDDLTQVKRKVERGTALYRRGEVFDALYAIRSGSFKSVGVTPAQRQKVTGLHLPSELLGLDAISEGVHDYDAIALEDSDVCIVPYRELTTLTSTLPELQTHLLQTLSGDITRDHGLVLRLGSMPAEQRIAAFLWGLSTRYQKLGFAGTRFDVRMVRRDIASYLGLTVETVCRQLAHLQRKGVIEAEGREVRLRDARRLSELVGY